MKEKSKALHRQAKAERIQHHQTRSPTNTKIFSRQETQKGCINSNPKQQSKWQWGHTYR